MAKLARGIRFDRHELAGAFGDMGTDLPLLVGMIVAARMDSAGVLILFGAMQLLTGIVYRMPMPVQPLKAVAAIVITQQVPAEIVMGGGLAIGIAMLVLGITGLLDLLARIVPLVVIRGLQAGLGLQLSLLALRDYIPAGGVPGYVLGGACLLLTLVLLGNRRVPPALVLVGLGLVLAMTIGASPRELASHAGFALPSVRMPGVAEITAGFLLLALPQIPLSLGNSILATKQLATDLFPERPPLTVKRIGLTYALMNLVSPFFGGVPTCHGSGGMAGHYLHGGRTGGSVIIYGSMFLVLGLGFSGGFALLTEVFPRPILGVLLLVEGLAMLVLVRDLAARRSELALAMLVALLAVGVPYGYLVAMVAGTLLAPLARSERWARGL
jgi:hypothetical protein